MSLLRIAPTKKLTVALGLAVSIGLGWPICGYTLLPHSKAVKTLEYEITWNGKLVGSHQYVFQRDEDFLTVHFEQDIEVRLLGVTLQKYSSKGEEVYKKNQLQTFSATTYDKGKEAYCNVSKEAESYIVDGSSYTGQSPSSFIIGTWWNRDTVKSKYQITPRGCGIFEQEVELIATEKINIGDETIEAQLFRIVSWKLDVPESKKVENQVWYAKDKSIMLKAKTYNKGPLVIKLKTYK